MRSGTQLFSTILRLDEDARYYLVTPVERWAIQVDDAPFVAVRLSVSGEGEQQQRGEARAGRGPPRATAPRLRLPSRPDIFRPRSAAVHPAAPRLFVGLYSTRQCGRVRPAGWNPPAPVSACPRCRPT